MHELRPDAGPEFPRLRLDRFRPGRRFPWLPAAIALVLAAVVLGLVIRPRRLRAPPVSGSRPPVPRLPPGTSRVEALFVRPGEIMPSLLGRAGIPAPAADGIIASLRLAGFNMRAMKPGDSLAVCFRDSTPLRLHYAQSYDRVWQVDVDAGACRVSMLLREVTARLELVRGAITSSLYQALVDMGERPALIADYTDVFSWEIDFFSEPQPGDSFVILVEKRYADPGFIGYGAILAARYRGQVGDLAGFRFTDPDGHTDYYNRDGQSLRKTFLKSPLRFSRISSRFGNRRHPILRARRMHHGIDYVAPTGTPVSCVADGRVTAAGWSGGYGRLVEVSHPEGYTTRYGHLSRFHRGIRRGAAVTQGQTIGYVGSSGMSTGPHLHYEVRKFGSSVNPLRLNPPRAAPVKLAFVAPFQAVRDSLSSLLAAPVPSPPPR